MFKKNPSSNQPQSGTTIERVTSVLGPGINWRGNLRGAGGIRIEGHLKAKFRFAEWWLSEKPSCYLYEPESEYCSHCRYLTRKYYCRTARNSQYRQSLGDVSVVSFSTEEGAFLRGQVRMEEKVIIEPPMQGNPNIPYSNF